MTTENQGAQQSERPTLPSEIVTHTYERVTDFHWLEFPGRPDEATRAILKSERWRWIGSAGQWRKAGLLTPLPVLPGYIYEDAGEVDHTDDRAAYYEDRAERASERASAARKRADSIADLIPMGQPILVGHHSERRHRRDLDKIHNGMRKSIEESDKAKRLESRAEAAEAHRAHKQTPGAIARRLDRMRKDLRAYQGWTSEEGQRRRDILTAEIARLEQELAEAGGLAIDKIALSKGDLIAIDSFIVEVIRVNRKTITGYLASPVHNLFSKESEYTKRDRRASGQQDITRFKCRIYTAQEWAAVNKGRTQAEAYAIAQTRLKEINQQRRAEAAG